MTHVNMLHLLNASVFQAEPGRLLIFSVLGIALLLFLIMYCKLHALLSILISAIFIGLGVGMSFEMILASVNTGIGSTLQGIALLVGIGSMFGAVLELSGGVEVVANKLVKTFGEKKAPFALGIAGLLIGIPVFFDAALIILIPLAMGIARKTKKSVLFYAIPLLAGLSIAHAFIPPTPGPIIVASTLGVDLGFVILIGILCGAVSMFVSGPIYGNYIAKKIYIAPTEQEVPAVDKNAKPKKLPSVGAIIGIILIPIVLILANTVTTALVNGGNEHLVGVHAVFSFLGTPFVALLISTLFAMVFLGFVNGYSREELLTVMSKSLTPTGMILLVTAGGGVLRFIFQDSGIGHVMSDFVADYNMPIILVAFLIAALIRISVGSATVSMMMAAGIIASMPMITGLSQIQLACVTMAIAGGATVASHFNDSGFWLVKSLFNIDEKTTLKTWTTLATINGVVGFVVAWVIFLIA